MKYILPLVLLLAFLATAGTSFAQSRTITEAEYWVGIRTGLTSARKIFRRRETETYEGFTDGKLRYSRTETSEYSSSDRHHIVKETRDDGKINRTEKILIGSIRYCRENAGEWKTVGCYDQPPAPLDDATETTYVLQKNKDSTAYIRTALFSLNVNGEMTKFITEDTFIVNADLSVRERTIRKTIQETKMLWSSESQKFEYGLKLTPIEAPIK